MSTSERLDARGIRPGGLSPKRLYRIVAFAEAVTWSLLIAGMLLKYIGQVGDWPVSIAGPIHGFVFLAYGATAVVTAVNQRWSIRVTLLAVGSAIVPYATIPVHLWLSASGRLRGGWRTEETDDPRDASAIDRLVRWFLSRPWLLLAIVTVGVVGLFAVLLLAGPPVGK